MPDHIEDTAIGWEPLDTDKALLMVVFNWLACLTLGKSLFNHLYDVQFIACGVPFFIS